MYLFVYYIYNSFLFDSFSHNSVRMASVRPKTRQSMTNMTKYLGTGKELLVSELPTLRDILRFGILLKEQHDGSPIGFQVKEIAKHMVPAILAQWTKANALFKPPVIVSAKTISDKVIDSWNLASEISWKRVKKDKEEKFNQKLDKLFDILTCKCVIVSCLENGCLPGCTQEAHITCTCPKDMKIPVKDIAFIKGQREKVGSKGPHQMATKDIPEHNRQVRAMERKKKEEEAMAKKEEKLKEAQKRESVAVAQYMEQEVEDTMMDHEESG